MEHRTHIAVCAVFSSVAGLAVQRLSADFAFRHVETATTAAFISLVISMPSGSVEDELLPAVVPSESSNAINDPAGWTMIDDRAEGPAGFTVVQISGHDGSVKVRRE